MRKTPAARVKSEQVSSSEPNRIFLFWEKGHTKSRSIARTHAFTKDFHHWSCCCSVVLPLFNCCCCIFTVYCGTFFSSMFHTPFINRQWFIFTLVQRRIHTHTYKIKWARARAQVSGCERIIGQPTNQPTVQMHDRANERINDIPIHKSVFV